MNGVLARADSAKSNKFLSRAGGRKAKGKKAVETQTNYSSRTNVVGNQKTENRRKNAVSRMETRLQSSKLLIEGPLSVPQTIFVNQTQVTNSKWDTGGQMNLSYALDCAIVDHLRERPYDFDVASGNYISKFKMYLYWGIWSVLKEVGILKDTYANQMQICPKDFYFPKAVMVIARYLCPYKYKQVSYSWLLPMSAEPQVQNDAITGTGLFCHASGLSGQSLYSLVLDSTYQEYYCDTTVGGTVLLSAMINANAQYFSKCCQQRGTGVRYGDFPRTAPDASFYALSNGTNYATADVPHFKADVSCWLALGSVATIQGRLTYSDTMEATNSNSAGAVITDLQCAINGCIFIWNRVPSISGSAASLRKFQGRDLISLSAFYDTPTTDTYHWLIMHLMDTLYSTYNSSTAIMWDMVRWEAAWCSTISKYAPHVTNATGIIQQFLGNPGALQGTFPIPIAQCLANIGPVVSKGYLYLPGLYPCNGGTWYQNITAGNTAATSSAPFKYPFTFGAVITERLMNILIDNTNFTTTMLGHGNAIINPFNLIDDMAAIANEQIQKLGIPQNLDLYCTLTPQTWGSDIMLCRLNVTYQSRAIRPQFGQYIYVFGMYVASLGSPNQIAFCDLMKAVYFCPYVNTSDETYVSQYGYYWSEEKSPEAQFSNLRSYIERVCRSNQKVQLELANYEEQSNELKTIDVKGVKVPIAAQGSTFADQYSDKVLIESGNEWSFPISAGDIFAGAVAYNSNHASDLITSFAAYAYNRFGGAGRLAFGYGNNGRAAPMGLGVA